MIDFSKIGTGNNADTVLPPREIFNALPKKKAEKFQYPRDVQSQVWSTWFERRNEESLVIKMNTGSGKTVVGLLILKSSLNENKGPSVYVCPDKYLVQQVIDAAGELGLEVTDDVHSPRFLSGKAILVTHIHKIANGRSVFGVGDDGIKINITNLVIDDAHACLGTIEEQFTIKIPSNLDAYKETYEIFKDSLHEQCESKAIEIEQSEPSTILQVPYWSWQSQVSEITKILIKHNSEDCIKFSWPLLKESLKLCRCTVNSREIEISPHFIPIHVIPSIVNAQRKIFMTATLVDDSILASHFAVSESQLAKPVVPDSAGDIGDRMILLPQVINTDTSDEDIKKFCKQQAAEVNVVVIVPSHYRSQFWVDSADLIMDAKNLYDGIEKLRKEHVGLAVLINRYDGIDLPGDACRLLVVDSLPDVRRGIDKIEQSILMGSKRQAAQVVQRIEQGMGRGIRSNDDYCVVFLVGRDLTSQLYSQGALEKFSPGTKAQLELSDQVSEQIKGKDMPEVKNTMDYCLSRESNWVSASKGVLASLQYSTTCDLDQVIITLRNAYDHALNNQFQKASNAINELVNSVSSQKEKGFLKQILAEYTNIIDPAAAQVLQLSAASQNHRVLKPLEGIEYHKLQGEDLDQANRCSNYLLANFTDPNKLIIEVNGILEKLKFNGVSANTFEENFKKIARYLGFESQRPELEYKKGPDVLWSLGELKYLVIECKNEAYVESISKSYCNQLNGSAIWFEDKYDSTCEYTPILIHPSHTFESAASPNQKTRIITNNELTKFRDAIRDFIKAIASNDELSNPTAIREKLITHKLRSGDFVTQFTTSFKSS